MKQIFRLLILTLLSAALAGCRHKDLIDEEVPTGEPEIVFDWQLVPDAHPASMSAYMYEHESDEPIRFEFTGRDGGKVRLPAGLYSGMAMNRAISRTSVRTSTISASKSILSLTK